jgi:rubrerythrin
MNMPKTNDNLLAAFAGESQANRKYLFFAENADKTGNPQIARLFRAAAEAETVHARNHLKVLGEVKTNKENLEAAVGGEHYEFTKMYPDFLKVAGDETNVPAVNTFDLANKVEKVHHKLFQDALKNLTGGKEFKDAPYYVCQVCGNTYEGEAPDKCPICGAQHGKFKRVE